MSDNSIEMRALRWALGDDTGSSSKSLCAFMMGLSKTNVMPPFDKSDRGRCIRLLQQIPEWIPRLPELTHIAATESLVIGSGGMRSETNGWAEQVPLIIAEGGF